MKTIPLILFAAILLLTACDTVDPTIIVDPPPDTTTQIVAPPVISDQPFSIRTERLAFANVLSYEFLLDGIVEDRGMVVSRQPVEKDVEGWSERRVLESTAGRLQLTLEAPAPHAGEYPSTGTFTITSGSDTYAGLNGSGTFKAKADHRGVFWEEFTGTLRQSP